MEYMTYEEYEEMKIQEAVETAQGIIDGKVKTIPFKTVIKQLNRQIKNIEKEHKKAEKMKEKEVRSMNKGGMRYTI